MIVGNIADNVIIARKMRDQIYSLEFHPARLRGRDYCQYLPYPANRFDRRAAGPLPRRIKQTQKPCCRHRFHQSLHDRLGLGIRRKVFNRPDDDWFLDVMGLALGCLQLFDHTARYSFGRLPFQHARQCLLHERPQNCHNIIGGNGLS